MSDPNGLAEIIQLETKLMKSSYHRGNDLKSAHHRNESKGSVYYTPNDSIDQAQQLQSSPMHINFIQENLNTYINCIKPEPMCKFDFDMHSLEGNLEQGIDSLRRQHNILCTHLNNDDDDDDETLDVNTEKTQMLNENDVANALPQHNKFKRTTSGKDMYYSLENVFDVKSSVFVSNLYEKSVSNKTIYETSETQATSSTSNNISSNNVNRSIVMTSESFDNHPSQSLLVLNEEVHLNDVSTSNSMPNIARKMGRLSIESKDDTSCF